MSSIPNYDDNGFEDDFEDGASDWESDVVLSEWHYYSKDEDYGKAYSGDYAWYLGNPDTGAYSASLNDSLETPTIDLGDGSEKYVSTMVWFGIDGPYDFVALEINMSGEWETIDTFPGDDGDYSEEYDDADENGWLYVEADVSEYEGDTNFRLRFVSNTYTQYNGLYVDDFTLSSLPPIPNDVGIPNEECMRPIHTHDASGVLHIEMVDEDDTATLGAFFEVWRKWEVDRGVPEDLRTEPHFSAEGIIWQGVEYRVDDTHELVVTVYHYQNGEYDGGTVSEEYGDLVVGGSFVPDGSGNTDTKIRIEYREK